MFACDPDAAAAVVGAVRRHTAPSVPVLAKLSPDVTDIVSIARACVDAGADGLSMINTLLGMALDLDTMRPVLAGVTGGLSGRAIKPVAVRCIWQVHAALPEVPILGMGGVASGRDAFELVLAGASAVSVGTAIFHDPSAPVRVLAELTEVLAARGFTTLADAVGHAHRQLARRRRGVHVPISPPIAVALDTTDLETAVAWAAAAGPHVSTVKVGLELFLRHGHDAVLKCREASGGRDVFLDLKLHDIPNTVAGAARSVAELAPDYLTVHASGGPDDGPGRGRGAARHPGRRPSPCSPRSPRSSSRPSASPGRRATPCAGSRCSRSRAVRARWCAHRSRSPTYAGRSAPTSR